MNATAKLIDEMIEAAKGDIEALEIHLARQGPFAPEQIVKLHGLQSMIREHIERLQRTRSAFG